MEDAIIYSEVYEILNILGKDYIEKIPNELYKFIEENRNKKIEIKIDYNIQVENQKISNEAIEFISLLNLKYWASKQEKEELIKIYNQNDIKWENKTKKIFENNKVEVERSLINIEKKSIFKLIIEKIKNLVKKNKS